MRYCIGFSPSSLGKQRYAIILRTLASSTSALVITPEDSSPLPYTIIPVIAIPLMDPEFLDSPVQGVSDLQASYDHALTGLVKAGTDLDRVGTELNHAQIAFHNAIDDYFKHLQLQIDNKDKAIRLMLEQKIETSGVMFSMQKQLAKLQDEKTTLKAKNKYLTRLLNANPPGENFPGISCIYLF